MKSRRASIGKSAGRAQPVGGDQKIHIFYFLVCGASSHKGVFFLFFFPAAWYDLPTRPLRQWDFTNPRCRTGPLRSLERRRIFILLYFRMCPHILELKKRAAATNGSRRGSLPVRELRAKTKKIKEKKKAHRRRAVSCSRI